MARYLMLHGEIPNEPDIQTSNKKN